MGSGLCPFESGLRHKKQNYESKNGVKIDLEIDGKQHKQRKEHDTERDKFLTENGFKVYRVEWNQINNEKGKEQMKNKIDAFIAFYKSL